MKTTKVLRYFDKANDILKEDITNLCFNGPEDELMKQRIPNLQYFLKYSGHDSS